MGRTAAGHSVRVVGSATGYPRQIVSPWSANRQTTRVDSADRETRPIERDEVNGRCAWPRATSGGGDASVPTLSESLLGAVFVDLWSFVTAERVGVAGTNVLLAGRCDDKRHS